MKQILLTEFKRIESSQSLASHKNAKDNVTERQKPRTMWTDDDWRRYYWTQTYESPRDLVKRALIKEDKKITLLLNHILNGYHDDNRKRKDRRENLDDWDAEGKWYLLCQLQKALKEGIQ